MLTTAVLIAYAFLHAFSLALHALQKWWGPAKRIADGVDRTADAVEGIAEELEPKTNPKIAVAKSVAPIAALALGAGMLFAGAVMVSGCTGPLPVPVTDIVDCTKLEGSNDWVNIAATLGGDIGQWSKLEADVEALGLKFGGSVVKCVAEELIAQYLSTKHATPDSWGAHDAAEHIRASASAPGKSVTFHTSIGNL